MIPKSIVIVGGGTAGWMCANLFAHHWQNPNTKITLVESDSIATVGVGEGSTPFLRHFFSKLNIAESQWMPACDATYKTGIAFPNWCQSPAPSRYFHPFYSEIDRSAAEDFFSSCQQRRQGFDCPTLPDDYFVTAHLGYQHLSPVDQLGNDRGVDYGYHFDAEKLAQFLRQHAIKLGVQRLVDTVTEIQVEDQQINAIQTQKNGLLKADIYVDCTGFRGLLIQQALGERYIDYSEFLFNNSAVALAVPNQQQDQLPSFTNSSALEHGWMWSIPLQSRTGNGYVYSNHYLSSAQAEQRLRDELDYQQGKALHLHWTPGRITQHWKANCVAIGLSQGFLEPLEAPMLNLIQHSIEGFIEHLQQCDVQGQNLEQQQQKFNRSINTLIDGTRDYLQAHYALNNRNDSQYWIDCRNNTNRSNALEDILQSWQQGHAFESALARHQSSLAYMKTSWYCLLSGMGDYQQASKPALRLTTKKHARVLQRCQQLSSQFPTQWDIFTSHQRQQEVS